MSAAAAIRRRSAWLVIATAAAVVLAAAVLVWLTPPSAADTRDASAQVEALLALDDMTWPRGLTGDRDRLDAAIAARDGSERQVLNTVATTDFAASYNGLSEAIRGAYRSKDEFDSEHRTIAIDYVGRSGLKGRAFKVTVWIGETRRTWDRSAQAWVKSKLDEISVRRVTLVKEAGVWRIERVQKVDLYMDASPTEYGPDTPHTLVPPGAGG